VGSSAKWSSGFDVAGTGFGVAHESIAGDSAMLGVQLALRLNDAPDSDRGTVAFSALMLR